MYRIFIVEDDAAIAGVIRRHLEGWGYTVRCAERFDDVLSEFAAFDPHLVLLDVSLPFFNGYHWCQEIRRVSKAPILFLTSASDNVNVVMAMQLGGDDLLAKPFDLQVLSAKVQALLRRAYDFGGADEERVPDSAAPAGAQGGDRQPGRIDDPAVGVRQLCG